MKYKSKLTESTPTNQEKVHLALNALVGIVFSFEEFAPRIGVIGPAFSVLRSATAACTDFSTSPALVGFGMRSEAFDRINMPMILGFLNLEGYISDITVGVKLEPESIDGVSHTHIHFLFHWERILEYSLSLIEKYQLTTYAVPNGKTAIRG